MADGAGGIAVRGGPPRLALSSSAVLAFHGGGAGAGVRGALAGVQGRAGDGRDILLDPTATAPPTVITARMAMELPATVPMVTAPNTVTTAGMAMEAPATVTVPNTVVTTAGMAIRMPTLDLATAMQANTDPQLDRGYPNYNNDSLVPVIIMAQSMGSLEPRRNKQSAPMSRTTVIQAHRLPLALSVFRFVNRRNCEGHKRTNRRAALLVFPL
jgi:hypothetical protein